LPSGGYLLIKPFDGRLLHTTIEMGLYRHKLEKALKENVKLKKEKNVFIDNVTHHPGFGCILIAVRAFKVCDDLGIITTDITERKRMDE
jgi:hypothetical protein